MIWNSASNANKNVKINTPISNAYTIIPPTITNSACIIGNYSVININNTEIIPSNTGIKISSSCQS